MAALEKLSRSTRSRILDFIAASPRISGGIRSTMASIADARGVAPALVAEIRDGDLPLDRSLQLGQWSVATTGAWAFPRHFSPGDHLEDQASRLAAAEALRGAIRSESTGDLRAQLINVDDEMTTADRAEHVRRDLEARLLDRVRRPHDRAIVGPDAQMETLVAVTDAIESAGEHPFLVAGTLLGFVREGKLMEHDYDVDVGLLPTADVDRVLSSLHAAHDLEVTAIGPRIEVVHPSGASADVFPHFVRSGLWWHATFIHEWWNTPFDLVQRRMGDADVWVPADAERCLDETYGSWRQPAAFYDNTFDTPNRRYIEGPDAIRFLHARCVRALRSGDRWSLEAAARELRSNFGVDVTEWLAPSPLVDPARDATTETISRAGD